MSKIWSCKIGEVDQATLRSRFPNGADAPMREAVREAYFRLTGKQPDFIFSGWGAQLTPRERECADKSSAPLDRPIVVDPA
jgi:hypothetical protein